MEKKENLELQPYVLPFIKDFTVFKIFPTDVIDVRLFNVLYHPEAKWGPLPIRDDVDYAAAVALFLLVVKWRQYQNPNTDDEEKKRSADIIKRMFRAPFKLRPDRKGPSKKEILYNVYRPLVEELAKKYFVPYKELKTQAAKNEAIEAIVYHFKMLRQDQPLFPEIPDLEGKLRDKKIFNWKRITVKGFTTRLCDIAAGYKPGSYKSIQSRRKKRLTKST